MSNQPPRHVAEAAAVVDSWLKQDVRLSAEQIAALSPADRLDYTRRRSNETTMPDWKATT